MLRRTAALVALALALLGTHAPAAEPQVVAVVACDPYAQIQGQVQWVGTVMDQPMLGAMVEFTIMQATTFKGLAGLDTNRPAGLVVTAAGDEPAIHGYIPVKDLDKLLDAFGDRIGQVEKVDGVRRISPPGVGPLDVVERDGWAIVGRPGSTPAVTDPTDLFAGIVGQFTIGMQAFPSRMPADMQQRLEDLLGQAAAVATQGRAFDEAGIAGVLETMRETEELRLGMGIDAEDDRIFLEARNRMAPESKAGGLYAEMAKGVVTVASPPTADGGTPALSMHLAYAVPEAQRARTIETFKSLSAPDDADVGTRTAIALLVEGLTAMAEAGAFDAALTVDTSVVAPDAARPVPAVTAGMRVKDGAAFAAALKRIFAEAGPLPDLRVAFDTGTAAGATLHAITLEDVRLPGADGDADDVDVTLAITPTYVFLLSGGDLPRRLADVVAASGKPDAAVEPMGDVTWAIGPIVRSMATGARAAGNADEAADLEAAADVADAQKSALVQLLMRPAERGMSMRLEVDAGVIRTLVARARPQPRLAPPPPATGGPDPVPFPVPVQ